MLGHHLDKKSGRTVSSPTVLLAYATRTVTDRHPSGPFLATITITLTIALYMVLGATHSIKQLMQLTKTSWDFELFMVALGIAYLLAAWTSEKFLFQKLARLIGDVKTRITKRPKTRKQYKVILEAMRT